MYMKKIRNFINLLAIILIVFFYSSCQQKVETKATGLHQLMDNYNTFRNFNGAILVAEKGQVIFKKAYGYSNFELETENTLDTKFRIASITKEITAVLVMQEVENGNITLDSKISDYLSEFPQEIGKQITIHQLLSHSSGILDFPDIPNFDVLERKPHFFDDFVNYLKDKELLFKPGSQFRYSNLNYVILANILEKVSGHSYKELMKKRIFDPVGMNNSGIDDNITVVKNRAQGYYHKFLFDDNENATYLDMSVVKGAGDIYSTVEDLFKFDKALTDNLFITDESLTKILTPNKYPNMQFCGYGWDIRTENWGKEGDGIIVTGGAGSINGFKSNYRRFGSGNCIIVFQNYRGRSGNTLEVANTQEIINDVAAILYGRDYNLPLKSGVAILGRTLVNGDKESLNSVFDNIRENLNESTELKGQEVLELCYYFLNNDQQPYIQEIMKLELDYLFSNSIELAQLTVLYYLSGEVQKANETLSKSIELNEYGENLLNSVAYFFLNMNEQEAALYLFKSNIRYYPESSNVYDSYAEALMKNGQRELAIKNYKKSLELNPDNENAKETLNILKNKNQ